MINRVLIAMTLTALAAAAIAAIDRGGITRGRVISTAPFVVGSTQFDVTQTTVDSNGAPATVDDLHVGMVVDVTSVFDGAATATHIAYAGLLRGAIETTGPGRLTVVGQTVYTDEATEYGSGLVRGPGLLMRVMLVSPTGTWMFPGQRVEVSGYHQADGSIRATRVALADPGEDRVTGVVEDVVDDALVIGGLLVDVSGAELHGFDDDPAAGDQVSVDGTLAAPGVLDARVVARLAPLGGAEPGEELDLEGFVTRFVSPEDFDVDGVPVRVGTDTEFENGSPEDLALDVRLSVDGVVDSTGTWVDAEDIDIDGSDGDDGDDEGQDDDEPSRWQLSGD